MKTTSLLAVVIATAVNVQGQNTYYDLTCQTSFSSPSATDMNNMGLALQDAPQATPNYCSGDQFQSACIEAVDYFTAAVGICRDTIKAFCIEGSALGKLVQEIAITCRNGDNLPSGIISARGSDGNTAFVELYH